MYAKGPRKARAFRGPLALLVALAGLTVLIALPVSAGAAVTPDAARALPARAPSASPSAVAKPAATCVVHSLPSFVAQGENVNQGDGENPNEGNTEATVADVIEVECNPTIYGTGSKIKITASQLFSRCQGRVTW